MAKPKFIELGDILRIPILYEDRSVIAIDKPPGWMLAPGHWDRTGRNLFLAITSSIRAGDFWARSRNLKFLRHVHRLDADTSGIVLLAKSSGAVAAYSRLFESRSVEKLYVAVVRGTPKQNRWTCQSKLADDPRAIGVVKVDPRHGQEAETFFRVCQTRKDDSGQATTMVIVKPVTGRTHQIRIHLRESGLPVIGDQLYGSLDSNALPPRKRSRDGTRPASLPSQGSDYTLALRAVSLSYVDPFTRLRVRIRAPFENFAKEYGFGGVPTDALEVF